MTTSTVDLDVLLIMPYGLYIVSSLDADGRFNGHISNSVVQVTDSPPRMAITVSKNNLTCDYITASKLVGVSILDQQAPFKFIGKFGFKSGRDIEKFSDTEHTTAVTGCPLVTEHTLALIDLRVVDQLDVQTHTTFVAQVSACQLIRTGQPMTYAYYRETLRGKTPPNAPSYQARAKAAMEKHTDVDGAQTMTKYECTACNYVYDPERGDPDNDIDPGTAFENLPDGWVCPVCGAGKDEFEAMDD